MTNIPLISIIVPVYNVERYIRPCLDSILSQTYTNWEAILVDDGSKDQSGAICDEYAASDPRFVVIHKQNEGVAKARITAFEHSKGDLITFIDSDDDVSSSYLEKLSKPILENGADMVSCDYCKVENGIVKEPPAKLTGVYNREQIIEFIDKHYFYDPITRGYGMSCVLWSKMVRREYVLEGLRQGIGMWFGEDQLSMFAMLLQAEKLVLIPDRLYHYIQHEGQAVKRYDESLWQNIIALLEGYQRLLPDGIGKRGLRLRTRLYIERTILQKMSKSNMSVNSFVRQIGKIRNNPFVKDFYKPFSIEDDVRANIRYWVMKLRLYRVFYYKYIKTVQRTKR